MFFCSSDVYSRFLVFQLVLFHDRCTSVPLAFKPICSRGNVSFIWDIWALCAAWWADVVQCHLVKGFDRNVFGNWQRLD